MEAPTISEMLDAQCVVLSVRQAIIDRNESELIQVCDHYGSRDMNAHLSGAFRAYMKHDFTSFEWVMFVLSRHRGYEELVAEYWIANWQIAMEQPGQ